MDIGRGEMIDKTNNVYQADQTRDALAKGLYSRLFDYLVQVRTNKIVLRYKCKGSYKTALSLFTLLLLMNYLFQLQIESQRSI